MKTWTKYPLSLALTAALLPCSGLFGQDFVDKSKGDSHDLSTATVPRRYDDDIGTKPHRPFLGTFKDKPVMALAAGHGALALGDTAQTEHYWKLAHERNFLLYEHNPLMRPLVGHPAAYYAATAGGVVATAWLGHRFRESRHPFLRRFWWVPRR
jgi:hypothetical protein